MTIQRALLLLLCVATLAACASDPQMKDSATLPIGQGVMVARLAVPYLAQANHLKTTISVANLYDATGAGTPIELHTAETFVVIPLPAGTYHWKDLHIGSYNSEFGPTPMYFKIVPGEINYVGDLTVVLSPASYSHAGMPAYTVQTRIYDYHQVFLPRLAAIYPQLWGTYPVVVNLTSTPSFYRGR